MEKVPMYRAGRFHLNIIILFFMLVLGFSSAGFTQTQNVRFRHLKVNDGLSQSWVRSICQDKYGFIWFGTYDGLNKYDGYTITSYYYNPNNKNSLTNSSINKIFEDTSGNLWIGTENGVCLYDRTNDWFIHRSKWPKGVITDFLELADGQLYITTRDRGLLFFNPDSGLIKSFIVNENDPSSLSQNAVEVILKDSKGNIWVGTTDGLVLFNQLGYKFITFRKDKNDVHSLSDNEIRSILEDNHGRIWVGTGNNGLNLLKYEPDHPEKCRFARFIHNPEVEASISTGAVMSLLEDRTGHLWIGTENGGLNLIDLNNFQENKVIFHHYRFNPLDINSLSNNSIYSLFEDRDGGIWVGTHADGINYYHPLKEKFVHIKYEPNNPNSLNNNFVNVFREEGDLLWIGTEGGVSLYNRRNGVYRHFICDLNDDHTIGSNAVWSIYRDSHHNLWIGTWAGGLNLFNSKNSSFIRFKNNDLDSGSISNNNVFGILEDRTGNLWIGTMGGGLLQFDYNTKVFKNLKQIYNSNSDTYNYWINTLLEDSYGKIWISTTEGVNVLDPTTGTLEYFEHDTSDIKSISDNFATIFFEDSEKNLWIGTNYGLNVFNRSDNNFDCYTKEHGLPNNQIKGILEDTQGNLWLSSNKGLSQFIQGTKRPEKPIFKNYDIGDGLQGNEFTIRSCWRGQDGKMYFGGNNGFNVFNPDSLKENTCQSQVILTNFYLFNKAVAIGTNESPLKSHISLTKTIILSYKQSVISLEYAALNFLVPEKNQYAYKLEGFEKDWNYVGNKRIATYTNLNPGKYTFHVKASNNDGIWNEKGTSITIIIKPPFWKTGWFKAISVIFIIAVVLGGFELRVNSLNKHKEELERLVQLRTEELQVTNQELEQTSMEVNAQRNYLAKTAKELEKFNVALAKSNEELQQFAYVASHDLQEPMRMISSYLSLIRRRYSDKLDKDGEEFIEYAVEGAKRMHVMINDLLQYSRVTIQGKPFEKTNMEDVLEKVLLNLKIAVEESGVKITHDKLPEIMADRVQMERLLQNLLGNAIKYCGDRKPKVHVSAKKSKKEYSFSIQDNGIGIEKEFQERIFGIFQRLHTREEYSGTGIGLAVCKKIVERHGGRVWVDSEKGKGSTFKFTVLS